MLTAEPDLVNIGLVVGARGALVVDTGSSPEQGLAVRDAVANVAAVPVVAAVVTHAHHDHAFGLAGFAGLRTVGHDSVATRLAAVAVAEIGPEPAGVAAAGQGLLSQQIAVATAVDLGERRVEIAHLGRGHTEGDLVVVVPDADVVFAGDLVESAGPPWYGADSFPHEWPATLDGLIGLMTDATRLLPGHGDAVDRRFVFEQRGQVAAVAGEIRRLADRGVPVGTALDQGSWPFPADHIRAGIAPGYDQLAPSGRPTGRPTLPLV